ncbi:MAG: hypothetical protein PWP31_694 [Clostridia bacterium]|nr:hypothetical protein [Clostridia bacterium]
MFDGFMLLLWIAAVILHDWVEEQWKVIDEVKGPNIRKNTR